MTEKKKERGEPQSIWREHEVCTPWTPIPLALMRHWHHIGYHETDKKTGEERFRRLGDGCFATLCWLLRWARRDSPTPLKNIDMNIRGAAKERGVGSSAISKQLRKLERASVLMMSQRNRWTTPTIDLSPLPDLLLKCEQKAEMEKKLARFPLNAVRSGMQRCSCMRSNCRGCGRPPNIPPEERSHFAAIVNDDDTEDPEHMLERVTAEMA